MQTPSYRTACERCGRVTLTKLLSEVQLRLWDDENGTPLWVMLCPEHRAALARLISDFLEPVRERGMGLQGLTGRDDVDSGNVWPPESSGAGDGFARG